MAFGALDAKTHKINALKQVLSSLPASSLQLIQNPVQSKVRLSLIGISLPLRFLAQLPNGSGWGASRKQVKPRVAPLMLRVGSQPHLGLKMRRDLLGIPLPDTSWDGKSR